MTDQTPQAGHNHPPSPLEEVQAAYDALFIEVENWADGEPIETDGQAKVVEGLIKQVKEATKATDDAKELEYRPHKQAGDAVIAAYKPFYADLKTQKDCLLALINPYKQKLLEAQQEATRIANEAAAQAKAEALQAATEQRSGSVEDARNTTELADEAIEAEKFAKKVAKPTVKGLRTKRIGVITEYKALLNWMAINDKDFLRATMDNYVEIHVRNKRCALPGVRVDVTKESF